MNIPRHSIPLLLCCCAMATAAPIDPESRDAKPAVAEIANAGYTLAFSDEFNGSALDTEKWVYRTDSKMLSTQLPANIKIANRHLLLELKKENANGKDYTGAGVISKAAFRYGYYEARMKCPPGAGWHTSFWMMLHNASGGTKPDAAFQELDVIENDSNHLTGYGVNVHKWKGERVAFGGKGVQTPDLSQDFHVFGCEFTPTTVKYYFDGNLVQTIDVTKAVRKSKDGTTQTFEFEHGDQNIWLTSIALGRGRTQKKVDDSKLPAAAEFDYVRFFTKAPAK
ncbi:MAG: glycoside hydrolase family 16 protein [Verrucomicrobia bacterium]|nr:glycoside hydrolase family 16 protein [Verrucomicrobiota bacterium]